MFNPISIQMAESSLQEGLKLERCISQLLNMLCICWHAAKPGLHTPRQIVRSCERVPALHNQSRSIPVYSPSSPERCLQPPCRWSTVSHVDPVEEETGDSGLPDKRRSCMFVTGFCLGVVRYVIVIMTRPGPNIQLGALATWRLVLVVYAVILAYGILLRLGV